MAFNSLKVSERLTARALTMPKRNPLMNEPIQISRDGFPGLAVRSGKRSFARPLVPLISCCRPFSHAFPLLSRQLSPVIARDPQTETNL